MLRVKTSSSKIAFVWLRYELVAAAAACYAGSNWKVSIWVFTRRHVRD